MESRKKHRRREALLTSQTISQRHQNVTSSTQLACVSYPHGAGHFLPLLHPRRRGCDIPLRGCQLQPASPVPFLPVVTLHTQGLTALRVRHRRGHRRTHWRTHTHIKLQFCTHLYSTKSYSICKLNTVTLRERMPGHRLSHNCTCQTNESHNLKHVCVQDTRMSL